MAAAVRAKETAVEKMKEKDFSGARKFALKAQKLSHGLENLDRMLMVCNVHCAAAEGEDKDWYKILDIAPGADEASVRKQCSRMTLGLHPDKNSFPGATEAFHFIVQAKAVLLDYEKRSLYDSCRRAKAMAESRRFGFARFRDGCENREVIDLSDSDDETSGGGGGGGGEESASKVEELKVSSSKENVVVSEYGDGKVLGDDGVGNLDSVFPEQTDQNSSENWTNGSRGRGRGRGSKLNDASKIDGLRKSSSKKNVRKDLGGGVGNLDSGISRFENDQKCDEGPNLENGYGLEKQGDQLKRCRGKPRGAGIWTRYVGEAEKVVSDEEVENGYGLEKQADQLKRGRGRGRGRSYVGEKILGDEEVENARGAKRAKNSGSCNVSAAVIEADSKILEYTDAEFNDFEKERSKTCFKEGQIWAVYDLLDAMPRFYALINNVVRVSDDHKLEITWLEPLPNDDEEKKWLLQGLPACFGRFKHGHTDIIQDHAVFSHVVNWKRNAILKKVFEIHPKKGETWAVFKNWDINWHSNPQRYGGFEYEVVEILSDYRRDVGVSVALLGKIEGFCCVYGRKLGNEVDREVIKVSDRLRFSHRIPSVSVSTNTPSGVMSYFELDPASLPINEQ